MYKLYKKSEAVAKLVREKVTRNQVNKQEKNYNKVR